MEPLPIAYSIDPRHIRYVDVGGVRTRFYEKGSGEPLVLLHGGHFGFVDSLDSWSRNLAGLATRFHVYALDKLGQGHTDNPKSDAEYTSEALDQHIVDWFRAIGIADAHVVGHSRGALSAAYLALHHPEVVRTVVFVDSNTLAPDDPRYPTSDFYKAIALRVPLGPPTRKTVRMEPEANSYAADHVDEDLVTRRYEIAILPKTQHAQRQMQRLQDSVWLPSLERRRRETLHMIDVSGIPVRSLVVWGFNDPSAPLPLGVQLFRRICAKTTDAQLHVLNHAGHYSFREQPDAFNGLLASLSSR